MNDFGNTGYRRGAVQLIEFSNGDMLTATLRQRRSRAAKNFVAHSGPISDNQGQTDDNEEKEKQRECLLDIYA